MVINGILKVVLKYCCRLCGDELKRKVKVAVAVFGEGVTYMCLDLITLGVVSGSESNCVLKNEMTWSKVYLYPQNLQFVQTFYTR